jgi:hypothetical protein
VYQGGDNLTEKIFLSTGNTSTNNELEIDSDSEQPFFEHQQTKHSLKHHLEAEPSGQRGVLHVLWKESSIVRARDHDIPGTEKSSNSIYPCRGVLRDHDDLVLNGGHRGFTEAAVDHGD